jgi:hypothetical protein
MRKSMSFIFQTLENVVSAVASLSDDISDHEVRELCSMARPVEDDLWGEASAVDLVHGVVDHKVAAPEVDQVVLQRTAWRTVVKETCNTWKYHLIWYGH